MTPNAAGPPSAGRPPRLLEFLALACVLFNMALSSAVEARRVTELVGLLAALFFPVIVSVVVVGVLRLVSVARTRRAAALLVIGLQAFIFLGTVGRLGQRRSDLTPEALPVEDWLQNVVADSRQKGLPRMVDETLELTDITADELVMVTHYRYVDLPMSELDLEAVPDMRRNMAAALCENEETRIAFLNRGVVGRYVYHDMHGEEAFRIDVSLADCSR